MICWRLMRSFRRYLTDCGCITFDYLPVLPAPISLPLCDCQQLHTANFLPERCVCVRVRACVWGCVQNLCPCVGTCLSTLKATLAIMCLMEDKQPSLRQAYTAKRFTPPQHYHAGCNSREYSNPLHHFEHTRTYK